MSITAAQVKELRERTGLGMMDCKKALEKSTGDMDAAIDLLRKKAGAKAAKKSGRIAADGIISIHLSGDKSSATIVEVNSETDFVAKRDEFREFASELAAYIDKNKPADVPALLASNLDSGETVATKLEELVAKLGENMTIRRFERMASQAGSLGSYIHTGDKIGVIVEMEGSDDTTLRDIAMHIAASQPEYVNKDEVPEDIVDKEKEILIAQAQDSGKPDDIIEKMVTGRVNKFLNEITLLGQSFVKDPDITIEKLLKKTDAKVIRFMRFEVGEGIDKGQEDFVAEVMAQVKGG